MGSGLSQNGNSERDLTENMGNRSLRLRSEVRHSDVDVVRRITESTGFFADCEVAVAVELVEERLNKGLASGYYFLFAEEEGDICGYACFGPIACTQSSFDLYWIVVEPSCQGQGIGRALLDASEKAIREMSGTRVYVETSSRQQYNPTRAFYARCGYREEATLQDFYGPGDSKVIYLREMGLKRSL